MNEKVNLQELTVLLAEKSNIQKKEAEAFLREFFNLLSESLEKDKQVKIKDFGTFKVTRVEDRESVNVRTGERLIIPAHQKISFSVASLLGETVNEPFRLLEPFEISELNVDNAIISNIPEDSIEEGETDDDHTTEMVELPIEETKVGNIYTPETRDSVESVEDLTKEVDMDNPSVIKKDQEVTPSSENKKPMEESNSSDPELPEGKKLDLNTVMLDQRELAKTREFERKESLKNRKLKKEITKPETKQEESIDIVEKAMDMGEVKSIINQQVPENIETDDTHQSVKIQEVKSKTVEVPVTPKEAERTEENEDLEYIVEEEQGKTKFWKTLAIFLFVFILLLAGTATYLWHTNEDFRLAVNDIKQSVYSFVKPNKAKEIYNYSADNMAVDEEPIEEVSDTIMQKTMLAEDLTKSTEPAKNDKNIDTIPAPSIQKSPAQKPVVKKPAVTTKAKEKSNIKTSRPQTAKKKETQRQREKIRVLKPGERLTMIALEEYGHKAFWVYIFEENRDKLSNPDVIPRGTRLRIPPAKKYGIDKNSTKSLNKAKALARKYL